MAEEIGTVVRVSERELVVEFGRSGACGDCAARGLCLPAGDGRTRLRVPYGDAGLAEGRRVRVRLPEKTVIWGSFVLFIFPILALIGFALLGYLTAVKLGAGEAAEIWAVGAGSAGLVLSFLAVRAYDRRLKRAGGLHPEIVEPID